MSSKSVRDDIMTEEMNDIGLEGEGGKRIEAKRRRPGPNAPRATPLISLHQDGLFRSHGTSFQGESAHFRLFSSL